MLLKHNKQRIFIPNIFEAMFKENKMQPQQRLRNGLYLSVARDS